MYRTGSCRVRLFLLSDAFAQGFDESDCKLQNLVRFDLSSLLLRVVSRQSRHSTCQESSRSQVSSATLRSDAAVWLKFFNVIEIRPDFVRKEGACVELRWHETWRVPSQVFVSHVLEPLMQR